MSTLIKKKSSWTLRNHTGSITPLALIVIFAIMALALPFTAIVLIELNISANQGKRVQAFYLADAGIEYGNDQLRQTNGTWCTGTIGPVSVTSYSNTPIGSFTLSVSTTVTNGRTAWKITSVGTPTDTYSSASIIAISRRANFSSFLIFREDMTASFGDGYHANGRVHVNDNFLTSGRPIFDELCSATGTEIHSGSGSAKFNGGHQWNYPHIDMPDTYDIDDLYSKASTNGFTDAQYTGSTTYTAATITFSGTSAIIYLTKSGATTYRFSFPIGDNSLFAFRIPVFVSGTVNGQVTIVSNGKITITNHLLYADTSQSSNDLIGLITKNLVEIDKNCPSTLDIYASILAPISPNGYFQAGPALTVPKTALNFHGSYTSWSNGSFVSGSNGFQTRNFDFDRRLTTISPPFFFNIDSVFHMVYWKNAYFL
jgi:hypothetical protein